MRKFLIGDTHFGHENAYTRWVKPDGSRVRTEFTCAAEADLEMIRRWNAVVRPKTLFIT